MDYITSEAATQDDIEQFAFEQDLLLSNNLDELIDQYTDYHYKDLVDSFCSHCISGCHGSVSSDDDGCSLVYDDYLGFYRLHGYVTTLDFE